MPYPYERQKIPILLNYGIFLFFLSGRQMVLPYKIVLLL